MEQWFELMRGVHFNFASNIASETIMCYSLIYGQYLVHKYVAVPVNFLTFNSMVKTKKWMWNKAWCGVHYYYDDSQAYRCIRAIKMEAYKLWETRSYRSGSISLDEPDELAGEKFYINREDRGAWNH